VGSADEPLVFDPGRWDEMSPRECGYRFIPFGSGQRICIGRHLASLEMKATLARIGQQYDLTTSTELTVSPQMTTQPGGPITVELSRR
jgi:cytochrome P450